MYKMTDRNNNTSPFFHFFIFTANMCLIIFPSTTNFTKINRCIIFSLGQFFFCALVGCLHCVDMYVMCCYIIYIYYLFQYRTHTVVTVADDDFSFYIFRLPISLPYFCEVPRMLLKNRSDFLIYIVELVHVYIYFLAFHLFYSNTHAHPQ